MFGLIYHLLILHYFWETTGLCRNCIFIHIQTKMQTLNGLVWPEIAKLATQEVRRFGAGKKDKLYSHVVHDTNSTVQDYRYSSHKRKIEVSYDLNGIFFKDLLKTWDKRLIHLHIIMILLIQKSFTVKHFIFVR